MTEPTDATDAPADERPRLHAAATVVLVRDGDAQDESLQTLMLRRNERGVFGGMWVFPGGRVDEADVAPDAPDDELAAARRAAAREAMEEAGLPIDPSTLVTLAHWEPPPVQRRGFATWFFIAPGPAGAVEVDGAEIYEHAWLTPAEVLRRRDAGEVTMAPPTFVTLTLLAQHRTVAGLLAAVEASSPERFRTQMGRSGETMAALWHGDADYEAEPGPPGARHRLVMGEGTWHYDRSSGTEDAG